MASKYTRNSHRNPCRRNRASKISQCGKDNDLSGDTTENNNTKKKKKNKEYDKVHDFFLLFKI